MPVTSEKKNLFSEVIKLLIYPQQPPIQAPCPWILEAKDISEVN